MPTVTAEFDWQHFNPMLVLTLIKQVLPHELKCFQTGHAIHTFHKSWNGP